MTLSLFKFCDPLFFIKFVGCLLHVYLGAFSQEKTGPAHWDVLLRARAIDNQVYVAACSPAADPTHHYVAWGHSAVVDPW